MLLDEVSKCSTDKNRNINQSEKVLGRYSVAKKIYDQLPIGIILFFKSNILDRLIYIFMFFFNLSYLIRIN